MSLKKGDLLAEKADESCRLVVEVLEGGAGFTKINCCGNELTSEDIARQLEGADKAQVGSQTIVIDEGKNNPSSCGLKVKVRGGGAGLQSIECCGNVLTIEKDSATQ